MSHLVYLFTKSGKPVCSGRPAKYTTNPKFNGVPRITKGHSLQHCSDLHVASDANRASILKEAEAKLGEPCVWLDTPATSMRTIKIPAETAPSPEGVACVPATLDLTTPEAAFRYLETIDSPTVEIAGFSDQLSPVDDAIRAITGESSNTFANAHNCWMWSTPELLRVLAEYSPSPAEPVKVLGGEPKKVRKNALPALPEGWHFDKDRYLVDMDGYPRHVMFHDGSGVDREKVSTILHNHGYESHAAAWMGDASKDAVIAAHLAKIQALTDALEGLLDAMNNPKQWHDMDHAKQADRAKNVARSLLALPSPLEAPLGS